MVAFARAIFRCESRLWRAVKVVLCSMARPIPGAAGISITSRRTIERLDLEKQERPLWTGQKLPIKVGFSKFVRQTFDLSPIHPAKFGIALVVVLVLGALGLEWPQRDRCPATNLFC